MSPRDPGSAPGAQEVDRSEPSRGLDEVLDVGVSVVRTGLRDIHPGGADYEEIQRVFSQAQDAIHWAGQNKDLSDGAPVQPLSEEETLVRFEAVPHLTDAEFVARVEDVVAASGGPFELSVDGLEELGIRLAMAIDAGEPGEALAAGLSPYLESVPGDRDRELWFGALMELTSAAQRPFFDQVMPRCARALRFARPSLAERLVAAMRRTASIEHFETLWPWATNELLAVERERGREVPAGLVHAVGALPAHRIAGAMPRLVGLDALGRGYLPADAFQVRNTDLFPLWGELLSDPRISPMAVPTVLRGLRVAPPDWDGALVLSGIWEEHPWAAFVLRQMLLEWPVEYASPTLVECCGRALAHTLEVLDPDLRGDPWTIEVVRWLGEMRLGCAEQVLTSISSERRGFLVHVWPASARRVARAALHSMSRRNR